MWGGPQRRPKAAPAGRVSQPPPSGAGGLTAAPMRPDLRPVGSRAPPQPKPATSHRAALARELRGWHASAASLYTACLVPSPPATAAYASRVALAVALTLAWLLLPGAPSLPDGGLAPITAVIVATPLVGHSVRAGATEVLPGAAAGAAFAAAASALLPRTLAAVLPALGLLAFLHATRLPRGCARYAVGQATASLLPWALLAAGAAPTAGNSPRDAAVAALSLLATVMVGVAAAVVAVALPVALPVRRSDRSGRRAAQRGRWGCRPIPVTAAADADARLTSAAHCLRGAVAACALALTHVPQPTRGLGAGAREVMGWDAVTEELEPGAVSASAGAPRQTSSSSAADAGTPTLTAASPAEPGHARQLSAEEAGRAAACPSPPAYTAGDVPLSLRTPLLRADEAGLREAAARALGRAVDALEVAPYDAPLRSLGVWLGKAGSCGAQPSPPPPPPLPLAELRGEAARLGRAHALACVMAACERGVDGSAHHARAMAELSGPLCGGAHAVAALLAVRPGAPGHADAAAAATAAMAALWAAHTAWRASAPARGYDDDSAAPRSPAHAPHHRRSRWLSGPKRRQRATSAAQPSLAYFATASASASLSSASIRGVARVATALANVGGDDGLAAVADAAAVGGGVEDVAGFHRGPHTAASGAAASDKALGAWLYALACLADVAGGGGDTIAAPYDAASHSALAAAPLPTRLRDAGLWVGGCSRGGRRYRVQQSLRASAALLLAALLAVRLARPLSSSFVHWVPVTCAFLGGGGEGGTARTSATFLGATITGASVGFLAVRLTASEPLAVAGVAVAWAALVAPSRVTPRLATAGVIASYTGAMVMVGPLLQARGGGGGAAGGGTDGGDAAAAGAVCALPVGVERVEAALLAVLAFGATAAVVWPLPAHGLLRARMSHAADCAFAACALGLALVGASRQQQPAGGGGGGDSGGAQGRRARARGVCALEAVLGALAERLAALPDALLEAEAEPGGWWGCRRGCRGGGGHDGLLGGDGSAVRRAQVCGAAEELARAGVAARLLAAVAVPPPASAASSGEGAAAQRLWRDAGVAAGVAGLRGAVDLLGAHVAPLLRCQGAPIEVGGRDGAGCGGCGCARTALPPQPGVVSALEAAHEARIALGTSLAHHNVDASSGIRVYLAIGEVGRQLGGLERALEGHGATPRASALAFAAREAAGALLGVAQQARRLARG